MKPDVMLKELEAAADALSVKVTYEALSASVGHGGLCKVKGQYRVIVDKRASTHERISTIARALSRLDTAALQLPPVVRDVIDYYARYRAA